MKLDLNCDLGEGEPISRTRALMRRITSANVACGGHAGTASTMEDCARLARQFRVRLGAHPGAWNRGDFGRGAVQITPGDLELLLLHQVGAFERIARAQGVAMHHIKLHGALYHAVETDRALAVSYLRTVRRWWPNVRVYARAGGMVVRAAKQMRVTAWEEAFADRNYRDDGSLVPRTEPNAIVSSLSEITRRVRMLCDRNELQTVTGRLLRLRPRTLCVHSDTSHAAKIVAALSRALKGSLG